VDKLSLTVSFRMKIPFIVLNVIAFAVQLARDIKFGITKEYDNFGWVCNGDDVM
jgi:hypothetical protein